MAGAASKCSNCGAVPRPDARFCESCGVRLLPVEPEPAEPEPAADQEDVARRFRALASDPRVVDLLSREVDTAVHDRASRSSRLQVVLASALFLAVGVVLALAFGLFCPPLMIVPLAIVAFALYATLSKWSALSRSVSGRVSSHLALVVGERTSFSEGSGDAAARTEHLVILEFPGGERRELRAWEGVPGKVTRGDFGVAYARGGLLIEFEHVPV